MHIFHIAHVFCLCKACSLLIVFYGWVIAMTEVSQNFIKIKEKFLQMLENDPELKHVILFHLKVKLNINNIDEIFKDYNTFKEALSTVLGKEFFEILVRSLAKNCCKK